MKNVSTNTANFFLFFWTTLLNVTFPNEIVHLKCFVIFQMFPRIAKQSQRESWFLRNFISRETNFTRTKILSRYTFRYSVGKLMIGKFDFFSFHFLEQLGTTLESLLQLEWTKQWFSFVRQKFDKKLTRWLQLFRK